MKIFICLLLLFAVFFQKGFSQKPPGSTTTYEHRYPELGRSAIMTESSDSTLHLLVLKNLISGRLDTVINTLSGNSAPTLIPHFGFIDHKHFVFIIEQTNHPYSINYHVIKIAPELPKGFKLIFSENIVKNEEAKPISNCKSCTRKNRYYYEVIDLTHINYIDMNYPYELLYFDLSLNKLFRTKIKRKSPRACSG
jgi:hypothetical protein